LLSEDRPPSSWLWWRQGHLGRYLCLLSRLMVAKFQLNLHRAHPWSQQRANALKSYSLDGALLSAWQERLI
jgi:hypothetical protein